ncbi:hypothetical protein GGQ84_000904 [Desulfitispora alkaliphila]|uniref:Na+/H+ antiporter family protein n=1 Tax=Desulfitispora alkaliphila TaxID=622674 RepID=UPI003D261ABD
MLTNPVLVSVVVMMALSLAKLNVIVALLVSAVVAGLLAEIPLVKTEAVVDGEAVTIDGVIDILIGGMGGGSGTALNYILLGALAVAISQTGIAGVLGRLIIEKVKGRTYFFLFIIAIIASLSQNLIPVHIAFIPILIPPLLRAMNKMQLDRRAAAVALTFGLKAPYIAIPAGYGIIFQEIIQEQLKLNGVEVALNSVWKVLMLPAAGMLVGLIVAVLFTYSKKRQYSDINIVEDETAQIQSFNKQHFFALLAAVAAFGVQVQFESLPLGALLGLTILVVTQTIRWTEINQLMNSGIGLMGFIAFVMLVASGYGAVIRETGGVQELVDATASIVAGNQPLGAIMMLLVGLVITMGIGTSFGTIPILAVIYAPLGLSLGFSPLAIVALVGTAAALGDAGSPASDSTLGPTAGLNADGQHDHIWDTVVPTFLHFNIPLIIFGFIAAMIF